MSENNNRLSRFWQELKRRKVIHVIVVYATAAFVIIELVNNVYEPLQLPDWIPLLVIVMLAIGFPIAIIVSWIFDISLKGATKTEPVRKNDIQSAASELSERPPVQEKSIIVLPFENISPDPDQEYFSDGLTEEIITDLSHIKDLLVISRSSAMTFKGTKKKIREIAGDVNVRYVLEGSVRKAGNNLRITAQLIDGLSDTHIWAEKYEETLTNVFFIQEKISRLIVDTIKIDLTKEEKEKLTQHSSDDLIATECWFRAKQEIHHYTPESFNRAQTILNDGLKETGANELLYWGLGYLNWFYVNMGICLDEKFLQKAEFFLGEIFKIDPDSFYGYQLQGLISYKRGDLQKSIFYTNKALEIEPNNPEALDHIIWMYADTGKTQKSPELIKRLIKIDPLTSHNHWARGWTYFTEGKIEKSLPSYYRAHELEPENILWILLYSHALLMANQIDKAVELITPFERESTDDQFINFLIFVKYAFLKDPNKAFQYLKDDILELGEWDEIISLMLAESFATINVKDKALYWLENAVKKGFINYPFLSEYDCAIESIRGEERFKKLMERVKKEWEKFKV